MSTTATDIAIDRLGAKLFAENPEVLRPAAFVGIFHSWIQARDLDGTPIDVADYKHVPEGPGVMLIAHESDRAIDFADGRAGAMYQRKRDLTGSLEERLVTVIGAADLTADRIEGETAAEGVRFGRDEIELRFHDRNRVPNTDAGLGAVRGAVVTALGTVRPGREAVIERVSPDPREPLTLRVHLS